MLRPAVCVLLAVPVFAQGWVDRTPSNPFASPSQRFDPAMCWDASHGYVLMFGGMSYQGFPFPSDTWSWNGTAWTQRPTPTQPNNNLGGGSLIPVSRRACAMAYHTPTNEVLLVCLGGTYAWTGSDWLLRPAAIPTAVSGGGILANLALGRDEARNQTVLFVGLHVINGSPPQLASVGETVLWDGFSWTLRPTATHPFPVEQPSMTFDPVTGRLLLCTTDAANSQSYFWDWNGTNWTQRPIATAPAAGGVLATDSAHNKVVMFDASLNAAPNHSWAITGSSAAQLGLASEPTHRQGAGCAFDPARNRTVLFGGINGPVNGTQVFSLADTWELELGAGASWSSFGTGCAGSRGVPTIAAQGTSLPRIGQTFELHVGNLPFTGPVFLFFGLSNTNYGPTPLPFALNGLGAPGCSVLCSGEELIVLTNVLGSAVWQRAIPSFPGLTFYNQAFAFDPPANALGLTTSNGGQGVIGL